MSPRGNSKKAPPPRGFFLPRPDTITHAKKTGRRAVDEEKAPGTITHAKETVRANPRKPPAPQPKHPSIQNPI